ncbi:peptidase S8/S53 domain-containing protein [Coprinopsis sp. MPI-PUGE-AT-0042]|nr:peptidase S8/S53 domain-containing protein [Coprinopsis sp. MPI-PUGE-AT-0042]
MLIQLIAIAPILASLCLATPFELDRRWNTEPLVVRHSWPTVPQGWERVSKPPPSHVIHLRIGLKQHRMDELISRLLEVSDPSHTRYGQHLEKEDVEEYLIPEPTTLSLVQSWLSSHTASPVEATNDWITLNIPIATAEKMLHTTYNTYHHRLSNATIIRTLSYSLPSILNNHINVISPTTYFGTIQSMRTNSNLRPELIKPSDILDDLTVSLEGTLEPSSCNVFVTPSCLRHLYNTTDYVPQTTGRSRLGVVGYLDEFVNDADLQNFYSKFRKDAQGFGIPTVSVNGGGNDQSNPGIEANLDVQYTSAMSYPIPNIYYSTGGSPPFDPDTETTSNTNEPYLDWLTYILSLPNEEVPQVITTSYGDDEQTVPIEYATRVCNLFAQLGARGTTVFFSSGDFGVGGGDCTSNDGSGTVEFQPAFPASCPFVTAVGGTTRLNPEVSVRFSGGGFSRYFSRPEYQDAAVQRYLDGLGSTYQGLFNPNGRAYPDLSAQANGYQVVVGGRILSVGGTSASSPTVAGIFALLNDLRLSQNKTALGFINPLLYSTAVMKGFNDIVDGSNPGCHTDGFPAKEGWDPITGVGTPDFAKLKALLN